MKDNKETKRLLEERIVGEELAARPERLTAWVEEAIARLAESTELDGERPLRVYLSPQDLEQLAACDLSVAQPVEWKADPALAPGEARVESEASAVRVGLEAGVREVRRSLREVLGSGGRDG